MRTCTTLTLTTLLTLTACDSELLERVPKTGTNSPEAAEALITEQVLRNHRVHVVLGLGGQLGAIPGPLGMRAGQDVPSVEEGPLRLTVLTDPALVRLLEVAPTLPSESRVIVARVV